jgi:uncharacterized membrane protein SirB2
MSPQFYYVLHLTGVLLVFLSFGLLVARAMLGQTEETSVRKLGAIASGVGLLLLLVSGFGLLSKVYANEFYPWVIIKLVAWLALGGMTAFVNRKPQLGRIWFWIVLILGLIAVLSAYLKPGMGA